MVKFATHCDPIWRRGCGEDEPDEETTSCRISTGTR